MSLTSCPTPTTSRTPTAQASVSIASAYGTTRKGVSFVTIAPAERLTIDRGDARRIAVHEIASSLHRGDRPPESKGAKIRCFSRLQLLLARAERAIDRDLVHAASVARAS